MPRTILVATIGTRDLAFRVSNGKWLNLGNDRSPDGDTISEQTLVQKELKLERCDFRLLTEYLVESWEDYKDCLQPIILGKLLVDKHRNLGKIYLVATNQSDNIAAEFRSKDTLYAARIIELWIEERYQIATEIIEQGINGENPADFEQMFLWWKNTWREIGRTLPEGTKVILCLKGGIGQSAEASRVTALSRFGEDTYFYDFIQDTELNRRGEPSQYTQPFQGTNYLWERKQKESLALLNRSDYAGVWRILLPYWRNSQDDKILKIRDLLDAAIGWNRADFQGFAQKIDTLEQSRLQSWWQKAYESAYLGVIRFKQGNTIEAFFHSFRAVEGLITEWVIEQYRPHITYIRQQSGIVSPALTRTVCQAPQFPELRNFQWIFEPRNEIYLYGTKLDNILTAKFPEINKDPHWNCFFWHTREWRNLIFHRLLKLEKEEVFHAWKTNTQREWEERVLSCLNFLSQQHFSSLAEASLMSRVHQLLEQAIISYEPKVNNS